MRQMQSLKEIGQRVEAAPYKQVSLTDPDARSMATSGKGTGIVGYNVQIAVDAEHHLIVAHEVTNVGSDRGQLTAMSRKARAASGREEVTVLADRGYYNGDEVLACEGTGILPVIPKTQTSGNVKRGLFTVAGFSADDAENDRYTCPAGEHLTKGKVRSDRRDNVDHYRNLTDYLTCALKPRCTPDKVKRLKRWEHESVLDKMQARLRLLAGGLDFSAGQTVEHPFGTLKVWMGSTHFLTRTLEKVKTEMSLQVLAYNMRRMINIFGVNPPDAGDRGLTTRVSRQAVAPAQHATRNGIMFSHDLDVKRLSLVARVDVAICEGFWTPARRLPLHSRNGQASKTLHRTGSRDVYAHQHRAVGVLFVAADLPAREAAID